MNRLKALELVGQCAQPETSGIAESNRRFEVNFGNLRSHTHLSFLCPQIERAVKHSLYCWLPRAELFLIHQILISFKTHGLAASVDPSELMLRGQTRFGERLRVPANSEDAAAS